MVTSDEVALYKFDNYYSEKIIFFSSKYYTAIVSLQLHAHPHYVRAQNNPYSTFAVNNETFDSVVRADIVNVILVCPIVAMVLVFFIIVVLLVVYIVDGNCL